MAGRRRSGAGLKAFADTIEPIVTENRKAVRDRAWKREDAAMEAELKRKYANEDFEKRLKQAGILRGISKGTVNPLTLEPQTPPPAAPKPLSPGDQATQQKLDLVKRLQSTDAEERRQAVEQLKAFQSGGFIGSETLVADPFGGGGSAGSPPGLGQRIGGFLGDASNRIFNYRPPGISGPVQAPTVTPSAAPAATLPQNPAGVTDQAEQERINQVLLEAADAIRRGADPEMVKKRVREILGY